MKLGIIGAPEAKTLVHAKELGLDFVEFDLNPPEFFGSSAGRDRQEPGRD